MGKQPGELRIALDLLRAEWEGPTGLARRQERRFQALLRVARSKSILARDDEPPAQSATSGKFRQVIAVKPRTSS